VEVVQLPRRRLLEVEVEVVQLPRRRLLEVEVVAAAHKQWLL